MAEDNQQVVVMNTALTVEAEAPIPVKTTEQPLAVTGKVDANVVAQPAQRWEYKVFMSTDFHRREAGPLARQAGQDATVLKSSLEIWLNEGWEVHFAGVIPHIHSNGVLILRRPR